MKKPTPEMVELLRQSGSNQFESACAAQKELAKALTLPLRQGVLNGDTIGGIFEAVNFQPERTIEFRLFRGTLRYETIMACLEFTYAAWFFTRDTGQQDLTADHFLKYISQPNNRKDTVNLRSYLKDKGFGIDKTAIVKHDPRKEKPEVMAEV